jgi:hypothetical protein
MLEIQRMIGNGIPSKIHAAAKTITPEILDKLLSLAYQSDDEEVEVSSHAEHLHKLKTFQDEQRIARQTRDFIKCEDLQLKIEELEIQKESFPSMHSLERDLFQATVQMEKAASQND